MPFNYNTASLAGKKLKRGKPKITSNIQDRLGLLARYSQSTPPLILLLKTILIFLDEGTKQVPSIKRGFMGVEKV